MNRRWLVSRTNPEYIRYISKAASISPAFVQILINRGIKTQQEINDFLNPGISNLSEPFELSGVKTAVERIKHAIKRNEGVLIHGDYDADGLTATAIMVHALRMLGLDVHYFIPNRITHGYGFNPVSIKIAKELGATLIITVDCGITSFEAASCARQEGIDVIITDHHEPLIADSSKPIAHSHELRTMNNELNFLLPDAIAVINPKLTPHASRLTVLSGAGIAFKIAQALSTIHDSRFTIHDFLDLAALGTIADVVPLTGENRSIVKEGIRLIQEGQRKGIKALKSVAGLDNRELRAELLSFTIIPRINAAGRIEDSNDVVRLLLSDTEEEVLRLSSWLDRLNSERQKIEEDVYQEARARLNNSGQWTVNTERPSAIVLSDQGWHQGVVGIVASRLAEEFYRPTFIFSVKDGIAKGSARSIPSFEINRGLAECIEILMSFGGHKQAAGIRLKAETLPIFEKTIQQIIRNTLSEDDFIPCLEIDADITLSEVNYSLIKEIAMLEPLGYGNEEPLLGARGLAVVNPRTVGNNHLKMRLKQGPHSIDAIGFDMGEENIPQVVDAVFSPTINEYNGNSYLQLNLKALRPSR